MVEHYNKRIQNIIQKELFKAKDSIKIAVAWFTNELLFEPLLLKLQTGVTVELILNKDEINNSQENDINFSEFVDNGGVLHWNDSNRLMHEKYCIIDNKIVIYGSYNWTNKAEFNDESIAISRDEQITTDFYLKSFGMLCSRYPAEAKQEQTVEKSDKSQSTGNATYSAENGRRILWVSKYNLWEWECRDNPGDHIYRIRLDNGVFMDYFFTSYIAVSRCKTIEKIAVKYEKDWFLLDYKGFNRLAIKEDNIELGLYDSRSIAIRNPKNGKWGVSDFEGKLMVSCDYDEVRPWSDKDGVSYWIIKKDNLYGLSEGYNIKYNCVFDKLSSPKQPVMVGGDYGWFDEKGEYIVDAIYSDIIEEHFGSWFEHFNPSFVTKCNDGSYGICTPKFGIEEIGIVYGKDLFDKIGIPEFNLCQKQESKVLEKLRESLILDILHEAYDLNHYPWAIDSEKRFLQYHNNEDNLWDCYIKKENNIDFDVRRKYFEEGSKYGNAPFFYLADRNHICLDVHCFLQSRSREDWRIPYLSSIYGGYNLRICEMSRELHNNDVIIISKNTKMLCRINERFYFCILQVVNISTKSIRYIDFNFNLLYSRFSYDTDHKSLNGKGNVTLQLEEKINEYKYDYLNLLTKGGTQDVYITLSNYKEKIWDGGLCENRTGDWLRKVYQFSYDYATVEEIQEVKEIIKEF